MGIDRWFAVYDYVGAARSLVVAAKYRGARAAAAFMAAALAEVGHFDSAATLTWIPTTSGRRRTRGYDQSEQIARFLGRRCGLQTRAVLGRVDHRAQTGRPAAARRGAPPEFRALGRVPTKLILVDDVATTGATLGAAARVLRWRGASEIVAVTFARARRPGINQP